MGHQYEAYKEKVAEEQRLQEQMEAERILNEKREVAQLKRDISYNCDLLYSTTDASQKANIAKKILPMKRLLSLYPGNESTIKDNCFIDSIAFKHPLKGDRARNNPTYTVSIPPNIIKSQTNGQFNVSGFALGIVAARGQSHSETSTEILVDVTAVGLKPFPYQEDEHTYWIIRLLNGSVVYLNNPPTFRINS